MTTPMTRWRLDLAYDGTDFTGWATQPDKRTVQGLLQEWIGQVLRLDYQPQLTCAGRTDAGVHARGQVAHVDLPADVDASVLVHRLGRVLPADVIVRNAQVAPEHFHARFAAVWRRYCYRLTDQPTDPLARGQVAQVRGPLDPELMADASKHLLGLHDFAAFCRHKAGATTIRTLQELRFDTVPPAAGIGPVAEPLTGHVAITVRADAFCHSMVRSVVGALWAVGTGRRQVEWLIDLLRRPTRSTLR